MLTLIALALIAFGGYSISLAFKAGYQKVGPILIGAALVALGFYILPDEIADGPDVYYRK